MKEKETEFTIKIKTYSKSTIQKISDIAISPENFKKVVNIVEKSNTEQEVVKKLDIISQVNEKEFTQKLMTFSKSTMQKIMSTMTSNDKVMPIYRIVMGAKTEQQVIKELENLQNKNSNLL